MVAALIAACNCASLSRPERLTPPEKYTSAFFSGKEASIFAACSIAASFLSVLKMLNSVSSATNAACVSSPFSSPVSASAASSLASPMGMPLMTLVSTSRSLVKSVSTWIVLA